MSGFGGKADLSQVPLLRPEIANSGHPFSVKRTAGSSPRRTLTGSYVAAARLSLAADVDMLGYRGLLVRYPQPFPVIL